MSDTMKANPVVRGCGKRVKGGVYLECGLSPFGSPLETFLMDPPVVVDPGALGLSAVGVKLFTRDDKTVVMDWVGESHYPNVADFVEEVRRFGLSRRVSKGTDFSKLGDASRILLVHRKAWVDNHADFYAARATDGIAWTCPKGLPAHLTTDPFPETCCASLWWEDVEEGDRLVESMRVATRAMPSFKYQAFCPPFESGTTEYVPRNYKPAIFMALPLTRIAVVRDPEGKTHEEGMEAAKSAKLPVELEDC